MGNVCAPASKDSRPYPALKKKAGSSGFVALFVIALIAALAGMGIQCYLRAGGVNRIVQIEVQSRQALYAAEGGLAWAEARLADSGPNVSPLSHTVNYSTGQAQVKLEKESDGYREGYWVTSEGQSGKCARKVKAYLTEKEGVWVMLYYQEVYP